MLVPKFARRALKQLIARAGFQLVRSPLGACDLYVDLKAILARRSTRTIFDVGANVGQTSICLAEHFPAARISSFEPAPATFAELAANVRHLPRVECYQFGLGAEEQKATMHLSVDSAGNSFLPRAQSRSPDVRGSWAEVRSTTTVDVKRLDDFCRQQQIQSVDLLKIDTQGFETQVLAGAGRMLCPQCISAIVLEMNFVSIYENQASACDLYKTLTESGYRLAGLYQTVRNADLPYVMWCDAVFI